MKSGCRTLSWLIALGAGLGLPAGADSRSPFGDEAPVGINNQVEVDLVGYIKPACTLSGLASHLDLGELSRPGHKTATVNIDCNTRFDYTVISEHGALHQDVVTSAETMSGFASALPYQLDISIPTDTGTIVSQFHSDRIARARDDNSGHASSGDGVALGETATLTFAWDHSEKPLLAGEYADTLTITVRPQT